MGTSFPLEKDDFGHKFSLTHVYLGRVDGAHYAMRDDGKVLVKLSDAKMQELRLDPGGEQFPVARPQSTPAGCLGTALAYVQEISLPASSPIRMLPLDVRATQLAYALQGTFLPPAARNAYQNEVATQTLKASGIRSHDITDIDSMYSALRAGKKVLVGFLVRETSIRVEDDKDNKIKEPDILVPSPRGKAAHAMVALGLVRGEGGQEFVTLYDPYSGLVVPAPTSSITPKSFLNATVIDM